MILLFLCIDSASFTSALPCIEKKRLHSTALADTMGKPWSMFRCLKHVWNHANLSLCVFRSRVCLVCSRLELAALTCDHFTVRKLHSRLVLFLDVCALRFRSWVCWGSMVTLIVRNSRQIFPFLIVSPASSNTLRLGLEACSEGFSDLTEGILVARCDGNWGRGFQRHLPLILIPTLRCWD